MPRNFLRNPDDSAAPSAVQDDGPGRQPVATHAVVLEAFGVPPRDRYQIVHEHKPSRMIVWDTGLGIPRTDKLVMLNIATRPRTTEEKQSFYRRPCERLEAACGIAPSDVMAFCVENTDEDWPFGLGRAQFLTGEL